MEYLSVEEAKDKDGLRLVLTAGVPGPFGEAAKALFRHHNVEFLPVRQVGGRDNPELLEWTRHRNAPIALYNDEAPRVRWLEIIELAERLGTSPSLFPENIDDRITMVGMINELAGENSFLWNARILMLHETVLAVGEEKARRNPMLQDYQYDPAQVDFAKGRIAEILDYFTRHIKAQGSEYLVADQFTAADIYFAYISNAFGPQPHELNPMPEGLRKSYELVPSIFDVDPVLIEFRDHLFEKHLELPLTF